MSVFSSVSSFASTLDAINSGKSADITLNSGGFHFVNHTTGQEEHYSQGGLKCKWSFALKRAYFVRDGEVYVAGNSVANAEKFKAVYNPLEKQAEDTCKAFDLPRKQLINMLDIAYTKALSAAICIEA